MASVCVLYNPFVLSAKAIIVDIPGMPNKRYAVTIAKKLRNAQYPFITCNITIIGNVDNAKYIAFNKNNVPVAIGSDTNEIAQWFNNVVIIPLEKIVVKTLEDFLSAIAT